MDLRPICDVNEPDGSRCTEKVGRRGERCPKHKGIRLHREYGFYMRPYLNFEQDSQDNQDPTVFKFRVGEHTIRVLYDGLILVQSSSIDPLIDDFYNVVDIAQQLKKWSKMERAWAGYVDLFNLLYFLLFCAQTDSRNYREPSIYLVSLYEITRNGVCAITFQDDVIVRHCWYGGEPTQSLIRRGKIDEQDAAISKAGTNSTEVLEKWKRLAEEVFASEDGVSYASEASRVFSRFHHQDYRGALLNGWIMIEEHFLKKWRSFLKEISETNPGKMPRKRRETLCGLNWTASIVIESLELLGLLTSEMYSDITQVRKARNDCMHKGANPTIDDAKKCLDLIKVLSSEYYLRQLPMHINEGEMSAL